MAQHYSEQDFARFVVEAPKRPARTAFERDRARVLQSSALRRLAAKTQVVVAGVADFPRTRLTHTLEVAQISREMGAALGADPDLTDLAGLAHDLGHPPFGHNGEDALNAMAHAIGGFEGNAQSFRVLTRLEAKVTDAEDHSVGLNLTRASLDSVLKYPWPRRDGEGKFNVYAEDIDLFDWVRLNAPVDARCFEAQVMDWSDDVAYSVHDVEDGVHAGHIQLASMESSVERQAVCLLAHEWYAQWTDVEELLLALDRILALPFWPSGFDGSPSSQVALKSMTSEFIGRFVRAAMTATRARSGEEPLHRYDADLVVPHEQRCEVAVLKALANLFVFQRRDADAIYQQQREVISDLVTALNDRGGSALDPMFAPSWAAAGSDDQRLRVVVDQVACLTDRSVLEWHHRFCG